MSVKKILALLLAAMMVFGMTSAMAANGVNLNDATTMEIPITQTLYFKNAEASDVYEPNLYYTYRITPGQAGATVKDHAGVTAIVKAGDMRGFGSADATTAVNFGINFSSDHKLVKAATDGKAAVTKKVTVTFNGENIKTDNVITPGVYRYIITATTTEDAKKAVGVEQVGTADTTLVLDVTVNNEGKVVGSVIHTPGGDNPNVDNSNKDGDGDPTNNPATDDENGKVTGFGDPDGNDPTFGDEDPKDTTPNDPTKPAGDEDDPDTQKTAYSTPQTLPNFYDLYTTYNVTITKNVTGAMGDKSNFFPFQTDISNSIPGAAFTYTITNNGSKNAEDVAEQKTQLLPSAGTKTLGSVSGTVANGFEIKHDGKINLIGVPSSLSAGAEVSVLANEYNNTADQYKVTAEDFGIAADTTLAAAAATTGTTAAKFKDDTANTTFTVTNNLEEISPTGVALRFAPYFAMFAAGCVLFLILATKRSKKEEE